MTMRPLPIFRLIFLTLPLLISLRPAAAQTTAITYHGLLKAGSTPADGSFDFRFILYNAAEGGSQVGIIQTKEDVAVKDGLVTTELDFGDIFTGGAVWLEVGVRPGAESGTYITLSPRHPITSAPYSLRTLTAAQAESSEVALTANSATDFTGALSGDVTGKQGATVVGLVGGAPAAEVAAGAALANAATDQGTPGTLVKRDAQGNVTANQILATSRLLVASETSSPVPLRVAVNSADPPSDVLAQFRFGAPVADKFRIYQSGGFVALGQLGQGNIIPATGLGERTLWHPFKAAFRSGSITNAGTGTEWDENNVGYYSWAGGLNTLANQFAAFAFGNKAVASSAYATASGSHAFAQGGGSTAGGTTSVAMGTLVTASGPYSAALGRYASTNGHQGAFVFGDASTGSSGIVKANADNQFVVRAQQIWLGKTNNTAAAPAAGRFIETSTGAYLSTGGAWTNNSSRALKGHFAPVDTRDVLDRVLALPVQTWSYTAEGEGVRHMGPVAEDFYAAFRLGSDGEHITTVDAGGVALAALQGLNEKLKDRDRTIAAQQKQLDQQQALLDGLRHFLCVQNPQAGVCKE